MVRVSLSLPPLFLLASSLGSQPQPLLVPSVSQPQSRSVLVSYLRDMLSPLDLLLSSPTPVHLIGPSLTEFGVSSVGEISGRVGDGSGSDRDVIGGGGDGNGGCGY